MSFTADVILTVYNDVDSTGQQLDLDGVEAIAMNYLITDILQLDVRGTFSREFRIPMSQTNQMFFGPIQNIGLQGWFDFNRKTRAVLSVETIPVAQGHIQIKNTIRSRSGAWYLNIVFMGETPDLAREVGEKKLKELSDLENLDHVTTYQDLADSVDGTFLAGDALYALTDKGFNFSEVATPGTLPVFNEDVPLWGNQFTLCINEGYLFRQIMADAGFALNATSLLAELDTMWMPFINEHQYTKCAEDINTEGFGVHLGTDATGLSTSSQVVSLTEDYDLGSNFASDDFTAPFTGWFSFFGQIRLERTTGSGNSSFQIQLRVGTTPVLLGNNGSFGVDGEHTLSFYTSTQQVFLNAGDVVQLWLHRAPGGSGVYTIHQGAIDSENGTWWKMTGCSAPAWGGNVIVADNAPDMKQMDFVRDKIKQFNLAVVPDRDIPNKITFEPLVNYIGSGQSLDWSKKLDLSMDVVISPTTETNSRTLLWTYGKEEDALNKIYFNFAKRIYGEYRVDDTGNDFATSDLKVELITKPTPCNAIPGTNIVIPKFLDDQGKFFKPGPRSLYKAGTADGVMVYDDVGTSVEPTTVVLMNHMSTVDGGIGDTDYDLNYGVDIPLQSAVVPYKNLYYRWWKDYINQLYDSESRTLEGYFALELIDIIKLSFADRIWIVVNDTGAWWRLLEVQDYNLGTGNIVKCKLIRILNSLVDCLWQPNSVGVSGLVSFLNVDGITTGFGTQVCCERYGYNWNEATSRCYQFNGDRPESPVGVGLGAVGDPGYPISLPGAIGTPVIAIDSDWTITADFALYLLDATSGALTITLPSVKKVKSGIEFTIKKTDSSANNVVLEGHASETIDRSTSRTLGAQDKFYTVKSSGEEWFIVGQN